MKMQLAFLHFAALVACGNAAEVTPVQKVIQLMQGMLEKGKSEKHAEQVSFAASSQFCSDEESSKVASIKTEEENMGTFKANIAKAASDVKVLSKKIARLSADEDTWSKEKKAVATVRATEKADYGATHRDYSESIDALSRAIAVLKKQSHDRRQKSSLTQLGSLKDLKLIPDKAKRAIDLFLQQDEDEEHAADSVEAPEANAYEFQANGIIEMLEKLSDKFIDERTNLEREEANAKHAFNMLTQDLTAQTTQAEKDRGEKTVSRSSRLQEKADKTSDLQQETATHAMDTKSLKDLKATCAMQTSDFEARQQLRTEEIQAVEKAVEILSSSSVKGSAAKHLPGLLQKKGSSLGQLRSVSDTKIRHHVAQFLQAQAEKFHSRVLAAVAARAEIDPYAKVRKTIKGLIVRLLEEANEEADHKGWCDTELGTNAQTRQTKTAAIETLNAGIDQLQASISKVTENINDLTKAVADTNAAMSKATQIRHSEKAENAATVTDSQEAQTALAQANTVLKEFYEKASEATSLIQAPYNGMADENGGVLGMLQVIESDFARLESETKAAEASGQKAYDTFMTDSKADNAAKNTAIEHKTAKKQDESQALTSKKGDLEGTQKEMTAALSYHEKLKPSCVDSGSSFSERVNRRKEEIASLQDSLKVMAGEDMA